MGVIYNLRGTSEASFTVGKNGVTIFQGTANPTVSPPSGASDGDVYIRSGTGNEGFWQLVSGVWQLAVGGGGGGTTSNWLVYKISMGSAESLTIASGFRMLTYDDFTLDDGAVLTIDNGGSMLIESTDKNAVYA